METKFSLYFSHSWAPEDVDLNLFIWKQVFGTCDLLVDLPDDNAPTPPYFINRIEELLRRSDLFLCVLPRKAPKENSTGNSTRRPRGKRATQVKNGSPQCSHFSLFEISLAERADIPRFVLYDNTTGFTPPTFVSKRDKYIGYNFAELRQQLPAGNPQLVVDLKNWLESIKKSIGPKRNEYRSNTALVLLPERLPSKRKVLDRITGALEEANYRSPVFLQTSFINDAELFRSLSAGGLVVAEVSSQDSLAVYSVAHARFIPSLRLQHCPEKARSTSKLPWLLDGHPGGYQHDIIRWTRAGDLDAAILARAKAMEAATNIINNLEKGRRIFERRRYKKHKVFISHNLPLGKKRALIDCILKGLDDTSISYWEYKDKNKASEDWRKMLDEELPRATHFVALFTPEYEQSELCMHELRWALNSKTVQAVVPFFVGGRTLPNVELGKEIHYQPLTDKEPKVNAARVVERLRELLELTPQQEL